jgi:glutamine synthetase adenylyltransferase
MDKSNVQKRFEASYREHAGQEYTWQTPAGQYLARIFGNSQALAERLIVNPELAHTLQEDPFVATRKPHHIMQRELDDRIAKTDPQDVEEAGRLLRLFKYQEMIRIVARDLEGGSLTRDLLEEWSDLADILISRAYDLTHRRLVNEYGDTCAGSIIALGKLGSRELNLSSDVDLLFIYEGDDNTPPLSHHEFYVKLAKQVSELLSKVTDYGFVFRVDHDLRPEGAQGTLANSIDAAERYYEYFGHDWERQALIRARSVAGDMRLGNEFIHRVRPFVFRKTIYLGDLKKMRRMKEKVQEESLKGDRINVKLGDGGIRALEFLVQAMQLIYGGRTPTLQEPNTFGAIEKLVEEKLIHPVSATRLKDSYSFLRKVENMLQMVQEQQIHALPSSESKLNALAGQMGHRNADAFMEDLRHHMSQVHRLFSGMFDADYERIELIEAIEQNLTTCTDEEEMRDSIPWFKHQEVKRIQHLDLEGKLDLKDTLSRLTLVAEVVIDTAWKMAWYALTDRYGTPRTESGTSASFAILGMGKLGSEEMDYGSDLDLLFIYSGEGQTDGTNPISNSEFFTRLAQRIISLITIRSRYGKAYEVDSELRPSGKSGMLVSTMAAFLDHHESQAEPWGMIYSNR